MKPEFDRETDALLRDHARRDAARAGGGAAAFSRDGLSSAQGVAPAEHLDADELNAFAENAVPEAARTRYLSHLADCDDCRRTATGLALAANLAPARDEPAASKEENVTASRRSWLAALFAPGAWRYAMPVVALLCVGVVALVLMKQVPRDDLRAARQDAGQPANSAAAEHGQSATAVSNQQPAQPQTQTQTQTYDAPAAAGGQVARNDDEVAAGRKEAQTGGLIAPARPGAAGSGAAAPVEGIPVAPGAPQPEAAQGRFEDKQLKELPLPPAAAGVPALAPTPLPTPAAQPKPQDEVLTVAKEAAKAAKDKEEEVAEKKEAQKSRRAEPRRGVSSENAAPPARTLNRATLDADTASSADRAGGARSRQSETRAREETRARDDRGRRDNGRAGDSPAETRTVAGRKFRREGDSWIDTAYNSSRATTVVRRNSEQYRALVADEPEIARIANSLGGEVVVVWKGRAYRIKP